MNGRINHEKLRNKLTIIYLAAMIITSVLVVRRYSIDIREMNLEHCRAASDYMWKAAGYYNVYEKDVPYELVEKYGWKICRDGLISLTVPKLFRHRTVRSAFMRHLICMPWIS